MKKSNYRVFMADFETTVYDGQDHTEVWAAASVEFGTEDVKIHHSIQEQYDYFCSFNENIIVYYHNLKFDGSFWLDYFINQIHLEEARTDITENGECEWLDNKAMKNNTFRYCISDMGQFYFIIVKHNHHLIEIRDSLKLLPFSVKRIGKAFKTKHQKLDMEYEGYRYAGCEITDEEKEYIANDVLVVKEALETMFQEGHNKMTIGSCCLSEFKQTLFTPTDYKKLFPNLEEVELNTDRYKYENADKYIRRSYRGGWCYVVKGKDNRVLTNGIAADVNSLYPSMMSSESGNRYPVGKPHFWSGNYIPLPCQSSDEIYYFVRIRTRFKLKDGYLPFIQIKSSLLYQPNECLTTSDIYDRKTGKYYAYYTDRSGQTFPATVELTLTCTDYELTKEHYELYDFEILDGCWFHTEIGLFDEYMEKWKKIKQTSTGAMRELAKLFLNNLYGKMASSTNSSYKIAVPTPEGALTFKFVEAHDKTIGYIPIGSAITSYARNFTIRAAQKNFYGVDKPGFVYADTDSIHCDIPLDQVKGINIHPTNFCCWKIESEWDVATFTRQKTYIEHIVATDKGKCKHPFYNIKCAGMPDVCKNYFLLSMGENTSDGEHEIVVKKMTPEIEEFISTKRTLKDFTYGLKIPGKLTAKRIPGGVVLKDTTYEMR